jgi:glycosyltransferase involved in cell wall biosynthesis
MRLHFDACCGIIYQADKHNFMKVALVYDRVNKWGGAERVLLALHELFPEAPLYTSVYDNKKASWASKFSVKTSYLQKLPFAKSRHEFIPFLMPAAFEHLSLDNYDLVISVTSESAKGIITKPGTKHICYCLTPTRYLWSGYNDYFKNRSLRTIARPAVSYLRKWDRIAAERPDAFVSISKEVQKRVKKYYGRDSMVIYPPVELGARRKEAVASKKKNKDDYFLIVSRLSKFTRYKRIDLAIEACNELGLPLKIVGEGNWKKDLEKIAGPTITFVGHIGDTELETYYENCKALIFPGVEDFGLTVVEAQGFGKPVIAFRGGGALETIKEGKTGYFFDEQTKQSLITALKNFDSMNFDPKECREHADLFSFEVFKTSFLKLVKNVI